MARQAQLLPTLLLALALFLAHSAHAEDVCYGPLAKLTLEVPETSEYASTQKLFGSISGFGANLSTPLLSMPFVVAEPLDACGELKPVPPGAAVLVLRGACPFVDKARSVQAAGGAAMLLYDNQPGCITMGYDLNTTAGITIASISLPDSAGRQLQAVAAAHAAAGAPYGPMRISAERARVPLVDAGAVLLWVLAVGTVVLGSWWSGADHAAAQRPAAGGAGGGARGRRGREEEVVELTPRAAAWFVVMASAMLLVLFFFLNKAFFYVLLVLFVVASVQSQAVIYMAGLAAVLPPGKRDAQVQLPWLGATPFSALLAVPAAAALAVVWAVERNSSWAWVLQDWQGVALMLLVLRTLRLPSLKVACILLPGCLAYDVFWVFIQPMLFGGGESVMVTVAQGGTSGEYIPMLLRVPHFGFHGLGGYSLLGFGDIILPGLLVAYCRRVDVDMGLGGLGLGGSGSGGSGGALLGGGGGGAAAGRCGALGGALGGVLRSYFPYAVLSYGGGLLLTYAALANSWFGDQGQPALLYLVPCTLTTVLALAWGRGHMGAMWRGQTGGGEGAGGRKVPLDHDSDAGDAAEGAGGGAGAGGGSYGGAEGDVEAGRGTGAGAAGPGERTRLLRPS